MLAKQKNRPRIIVFNNFDMKLIHDRWLHADRGFSSYQLWGCAELVDMGFPVEILPYRSTGILRILSDRLRILGDLDLQWKAWRAAKPGDIIYCAHHPSATVLGLLRRLGILRNPLVVVGYQSPKSESILSRALVLFSYKGFDRFLCMSYAMEEDYVALGCMPDRLAQIRWGFDPNFHTHPNRTDDIPLKCIGIGKAYRDYGTLADGFPSDIAHLTICAAGRDPALSPKQMQKSEITHIKERLDNKSFNALLDTQHIALVPIDIAGLRSNNAAGLTAILEAMSCGLPLITTRNPYLGIDIEREGVGLWAEPNDPASWNRTIHKLAADPSLRAAMGQAGRNLVENRLNIAAFGGRLAQEIEKVAPF